MEFISYMDFECDFCTVMSPILASEGTDFWRRDTIASASFGPDGSSQSRLTFTKRFPHSNRSVLPSDRSVSRKLSVEFLESTGKRLRGSKGVCCPWVVLTPILIRKFRFLTSRNQIKSAVSGLQCLVPQTQLLPEENIPLLPRLSVNRGLGLDTALQSCFSALPPCRPCLLLRAVVMPALLGFWVSRVVAACASGTPCVLLHSPKPLLCWNSKQGRTPNMDMGIAARGGTAMDDKEMVGNNIGRMERVM